MYETATRVPVANSDSLTASGHASAAQLAGSSCPTPARHAPYWLGSMRASAAYALGKMLMWLGRCFDGASAGRDNDPSAARLTIRRIEDADPWMAPPAFWY